MFYLEHISFSPKRGIIFKDKQGRTLSWSNAFSKITNRILNYAQDLELFIVRLVGFIPFFIIRRFFYTLSGVKIGKRAHVHMGTQFFNPSGVEIGEGSIIGQNAFLDGREKLVIGKYVDIASDVMIYNSEHDINSVDFAPVGARVEIGDYCFIGPRVIILPGVKVARGAVVAAGAVVTKDVEEFSIVGGVPAKAIGERQLKDLNYTLGRSRLFQ